MAVGDIVSGISAVATILVFQPAAGTSFIITWTNGNTGAGGADLYNGTIKSTSTTFGGQAGVHLNMKLIINNTNYLYIDSQGGGNYSGYSGMQIQ